MSPPEHHHEHTDDGEPVSDDQQGDPAVLQAGGHRTRGQVTMPGRATSTGPERHEGKEADDQKRDSAGHDRPAGQPLVPRFHSWRRAYGSGQPPAEKLLRSVPRSFRAFPRSRDAATHANARGSEVLSHSADERSSREQCQRNPLPLGGLAEGAAQAGPATPPHLHRAADARARLSREGLPRPDALARERAADLHPRGSPPVLARRRQVGGRRRRGGRSAPYSFTRAASGRGTRDDARFRHLLSPTTGLARRVRRLSAAHLKLVAARFLSSHPASGGHLLSIADDFGASSPSTPNTQPKGV